MAVGAASTGAAALPAPGDVTVVPADVSGLNATDGTTGWDAPSAAAAFDPGLPAGSRWTLDIEDKVPGQWEVTDEHGFLAGIVDFGWPEHGVLGEFDGKVKYGRLLKPGQSASDIVFAEKQREDRLREITGFTVRRFVWDDLSRPVITAQRLAAALKVPIIPQLPSA